MSASILQMQIWSACVDILSFLKHVLHIRGMRGVREQHLL
jgi:hypothetical protein